MSSFPPRPAGDPYQSGVQPSAPTPPEMFPPTNLRPGSFPPIAGPQGVYAPAGVQPLGYHGASGNAYGVQCPRCGDYRADRVTFTWWGGLVGPKLFNHVKCLSCGKGYNGKNGKDNTTAVTIYIVISLCLALAVAAYAFFRAAGM